MRKTLRFMVIAATAAMVMLSTNAMADDGEKTTEQRVSANGSYQFKPSWGIGLQYGLTFTEMTNWNDYLLIPGHQNYFDVNFVADHELYVEFTPVEGFRISVMGGFSSLYISDTGFSYAFGGVEPAFSVRRSFYEFAVGLGLGYGYSLLDSDSADDMDGHGLLLRPFVEARFYPCDIFAIYLRLAFSYYKEFGLEASDFVKANDKKKVVDEEKLSYAGPNVAVGVRFGSYPEPVLVVPDSDGDGVLDDIDDCPDVAGDETHYGCPNPDSDGDGLCDAWVSEKGLSSSFTATCKGIDKCENDAEDIDGFEDEDGCPDPDNDKDGICDAWVAEQGLSDKYADVCSGSDKCADDAEDIDGFLDKDGCADPDNDGDGLCDPWVSEKGLSEKYAAVCKEKDLCPNVSSNMKGTYGCGNPDPDGDGYCDAWVYEQNIASYFPQCKGLDQCPNEKGEDTKGCIKRRVEVTEAAIQINDTINFAVNKATIKKDSDSLLEEIAQVFKDNPQIKKVSIEGHTDLSGNAKKNQKLSEDRAKAVMDRLVKLGVDPARMESKGFGSSKPVEPLAKGQKKETKEQAAKNRRVEFNIIEQDQVKKTMTVDQARNAGYTRDQVRPLDTNGNPVPATASKNATTTVTPAPNSPAAASKADAKAAADKAVADAKAAADKKAADAKAAADKAVADAKAAADKKAADAKAAADKAAADKKAAEAKAKAAADKAAADAKAAADKASAAAKAAADKAAADKKSAEEKAAAAAAAAKKASSSPANAAAAAEAAAAAAAAASKK